MSEKYRHEAARAYLRCGTDGYCNGCPHDRMKDGKKICSGFEGKGIHDAIAAVVARHVEDAILAIFEDVARITKGGI